MTYFEMNFEENEDIYFKQTYLIQTGEQMIDRKQHL